MHEWTPELVVDEDLARRLIGARFPELDVRSLTLLAEGWDNVLWVADGEWAFRFPQRALGVRGVARELEILPRLAPLLPLAVPVPVFRGEPTGDYPWPFFGFRLIAGREAALAALDNADRVELARPLGRFLRTLHGVGAAAVADVDVPLDPLGRADPSIRVPRARERLAELERAGIVGRMPEAYELLEAAARLPPSAARVLVHGDLHSRHLLVDDGKRLVGLIDWGDACLADPSVDLSIVWSFLPAEGRRVFADEYGPIDEETHLRARMLALHLAASIAYYAHIEGMTVLESEALEGLRRAVTH